MASGIVRHTGRLAEFTLSLFQRLTLGPASLFRALVRGGKSVWIEHGVTYANAILYCPGGKSAVAKPLAAKAVSAVSIVEPSGPRRCNVTVPKVLPITSTAYFPPSRGNVAVVALKQRAGLLYSGCLLQV